MVIHYYSQAFLAYRLGDITPRKDGRLTFRLGAHHEPFGLLLAFLLSVLPTFSGVAWGKPVKTNPYAIRGGRFGNLMVGLIGPFSNLAVAFLINLAANQYINSNFRRVFEGSLRSNATDLSIINDPNFFIARFLYYLILVNVLLFAFNLYIPLAPLGGLRNWLNILPRRWEPTLQPLETYGPYILLVIIFVLPFFFNALHFNLLGIIINPLVNAVMGLFGLTMPY